MVQPNCNLRPATMDSMTSQTSYIPQLPTQQDLNTKTSKEEYVRPVAGNYSPHSITNNNRSCLIDFTTEYTLVVKSTHFAGKNIHGNQTMEKQIAK